MRRRLFLGNEAPVDEPNPFSLGGGLTLASNIDELGNIINIPSGSASGLYQGGAAFAGLGVATDPGVWKDINKMAGGKRDQSKSPAPPRASKRVTPETYTSARPRRGIPLPPALPNMTEPWQKVSARAGTDGEEVPVAKVPKLLSKVVPNHFTIDLPYVVLLDVNPGTYLDVNSTPIVRIRLNSVYDPIVGATADVQPQGRDLWASHFKYYRVLGCHVVLTLSNTHPNAQSAATVAKTTHFGAYVWGFELCDQDQTICGTRDAFLVSKHAKRSFIKAAKTHVYYNGATSITIPIEDRSDTISYTYNPNDWNYHIREVGSEERWTPIAQNPSVDHDLVVRAFHCRSDAPISDSNLMALAVQIMYTVQFMEEDEAAYKVRDVSAAAYPDGGGGADD